MTRPRVFTPRRSLALLGAVTFLLATASGCGSGSDSSSASPPPAQVSPTTTAPTTSDAPSVHHSPTVKVPSAVRRGTRQGTSAFVLGGLSILRDPRKQPPTSGLPAAGAALQGLLAQRSEYAQSNYHVEGRPRIVSQRIISAGSHPPRVVVEACVDNSRVHVVDSSGHRVPGQNAPDQVRNEYTVTRRGGAWVVVKSGFASNPVC